MVEVTGFEFVTNVFRAVSWCANLPVNTRFLEFCNVVKQAETVSG
jgi:hypothetical protein